MNSHRILNPDRAHRPPEDVPHGALDATDKPGAWKLGWAGGWLDACSTEANAIMTPLTTEENEVMCLIHAAEAYSAARKSVNKPTSRIDGLIERLKMSPQGYDLVWAPRPKKDESK